MKEYDSVNTRRLDVGCGKNLRDGHIGIDKSSLSDAYFIIDVEKEHLPYGDFTVDSIYCSHTLEHIEDIIFVMNEFWRVLKWEGTIEIHVPHVDCELAWQDPTHKRYFNEHSWKFFCGNYIVKHKLDYGIKACFAPECVETYAPNNRPNYCNMIKVLLRKNRKYCEEYNHKFPFCRHKVIVPLPEENATTKEEDIMKNKDYFHLVDFQKHLGIITNKKIDATKRYGADSAPLGAKGLYADINRKTKRLKRFFWDGEQTTSENIKDTCYDLAIYAILAVMAYEEEEDGENG